MSKIYVSLASYRDPYLESTIDSLFLEADSPENITVGCLIHSLKEEVNSLSLKSSYKGKVNYEIEEAGQVFSVTECRNRCLKWLDDSYEYVLQIDSHSRFDKGWDTRLKSVINSIDNKKALLSAALPVFDIMEDGTEQKTLQDYLVSFDMHTDVTKQSLLRSYDLAPKSVVVENINNKEFVRHWYTTGHFIFARAEYFKDVIQPDWVLFWGEEVFNSLRTFTAGWDVYVPKNIPIYHLYSVRAKRPRLHEDFPDGYFSKRDYTTDRIIDIMSGKNVSKGDIFYQRTVNEFYDYVGYNLGEIFSTWREFRNELVEKGRE